MREYSLVKLARSRDLVGAIGGVADDGSGDPDDYTDNPVIARFEYTLDALGRRVAAVEIYDTDGDSGPDTFQIGRAHV